MPRRAEGPWQRGDRPWFYATIRGKDVNLQTTDPDEARRRWHELLSQQPDHAAGRLTVGSLAVAEVLRDYLLWCRANRAEQTYRWYQWRIKSFKTFVGEDLGVEELKPLHVTNWLSAHPKWEQSMRHGCTRAVQTALKWAEDEGRIDRSPIRGMRKPGYATREFTFSPGQLTSILEAARPAFRPLLEIAIATGCRPQELRLARVEDCAADGSNITLTAKRDKRKRARVIYVPSSRQDVVRALATERGSGHLFRNSRGAPWTTSAVVQAMEELRQRVGLPDEAVAYAIRHTWITDALRKGLTVAEVARLAGTSIEMVSRVYEHLEDGDLRRAAEKLS